MAQNVFNLYSASIYAEHPTALWNLDEDFSFLSLISASSAWTVENGVSASVASEPRVSPVETVGVGNINIDLEHFSANQDQMILYKPSFSVKNESEIFVQNDVDINKRTANVSTYIYGYDSNIVKYSIGVRHRPSASAQWIYDVSEYTDIDPNQWKKISHTFKAINFSNLYGFDENDIDPAFFPKIERDYYPVLIVDFEQNSGVVSLYNFSTGQWSEQYNYETTGAQTNPFSMLSSSASFAAILQIANDDIQYIKYKEIDPYGFSDADVGYFLTYKNIMLARNSKLPMVFGSANVTEIHSTDTVNLPSIILPGKGLFHESGKYKELTCEFWLRLSCDSDEEIKIFGSLASEDGIYVNKEFLILKVGHKRKSYFINKWYRPMLLDIRYNPLFISVLINGDLVMSTDIDPLDTIFPNDLNYNTDWIAFYGNASVYPFEIDCVAIYPYIVSEQAAKRKFVYGQGVGRAEEITKRFDGVSVSIDFPFAEYTANLIYPDMSKWDSGFFSNINANSRFISLPQYSLPEIVYVGDDLQAFQIARLRRTWGGLIEEGTVWSDWKTGVWRAISKTREANVLVDNYDSQIETTENFYLKLTPNSVYEDLYGSISFPSMAQISENVASVMALFSMGLNDKENIQNNETSINLLHFRNRSNNDILNVVIEVGTLGQETIKYVFNGITIEEQNIALSYEEQYFLVGFDIQTFSDSYFSIIKNFFSVPQNILMTVGGTGRNQFPGKIFKIFFNNKMFTEKDLDNYFKTTGAADCCNTETTYFPIILNYIGNYTVLFKKSNSSMIMDIGSCGYWEDSIPLSTFGTYIRDKNGNASYYDLDALQFNMDYPGPLFLQGSFDQDRSVNVYATIQRYQDVGGINYSNYTIIKDLDEKKYIDFDDEAINLDITKFRIIDGTIMFPPKTKVDFKDAYITIHIEMKSDGTHTSPINLQRMSISSLAFDQTILYPINSPTGNKFYPFTRQAGTYTNKIKNPFLIYKDTTPYLYLTADSGASTIPYSALEDENSSNFNRGLSVAINPNKENDFKIYGFSAWVNYNRQSSIEKDQKAFSIFSVDERYDFIIESEMGRRRAKVVPYLYNISGNEAATNVSMYQNGVEADTYVYPMSWSLITVEFDQPMIFDESLGQLEFYPGVIFNNVSLYKKSINGKVDDIFESHLGLSNIVTQDSSTLLLESNELDIFSDVTWSTFSGKPV